LLIEIDEEITAISRFDKVLLLQASEAAALNALLPTPSAIVTRRPPLTSYSYAEPSASKIRGDDQIEIGFLGTSSEFNIDALHFLQELACDLDEVVLLVAGSVSNHADARLLTSKTHLLGPIPDLGHFYSMLDISANMIRFGSGLKTKNVEALLMGVPVITSELGAEGLEDFLGEGVYIARDPAEFARLVHSVHARFSIDNERARLKEYAAVQFSPGNVYNDLARYLCLA
jgi:glycosyltransferase involved in cell wall biosynthesis